MQYGPARLFPRAYELPGGPPSDDAVLVTCAYLMDGSSPWVMQSLFLTAIGDAKEKGAGALEAFSYHYPEGESSYERFRVHRTVFPHDFLADFGFRTLRHYRPRRARASRARRPAARVGAGAREGAACGEGGVRTRPRSCAPVDGPPRRLLATPALHVSVVYAEAR